MSSKNNPYLKVIDYTVYGEAFQLVHNLEMDYLETRPKPSADKLPAYYKSEDYISHTNAKRNLFEKVYHQIRNISLKRKLKLINSFNPEDKQLLDIGCGTGAFLKTAQNNGWHVCGVEPDTEARTVANNITNNKVFNVDHLLNLKEHSFDVITLWHVLEHLPNLDEQVSVLKRLLKPNGFLLIAVPNYKSYDASVYKNFWAAYDVPRHLWHFSQTAIKKLFGKEHMEVVKTYPMIFDAFYVSLLSEKYRNNSMNLIRAFTVGLQSNLKAKRSESILL
ncbi:class I SAM-dependent methyltransferase [Lacinutrix neustonica]|uniref:class I SAM-dependent methyltransferase n=1 Tax=Lacinutrix neustonica TaxID=2980107 RepID=UPI0028BE8D29|nr:class I SAM-dependent methyltransferase [Lacinutrix neustonica]